MNKNFLLTTSISEKLYHECAASLPLIDYHNHISIEELAGNVQFNNLTKLWIDNDPYKHRAMRICGIDEKYITGEADDFSKFQAWISVIPKLIGNPLYHWSIIEMQRVFDIDIDTENIDCTHIWNTANQKLQDERFSALEIFARFNVEYAAPCAKLTDDITLFLKCSNIAPSMRGDDIVNITNDTIDKLATMTKVDINTLDDFIKAVSMRIDIFHEAGCRFSDHALDSGFVYFESDGLNDKRFERLRSNKLHSNDAKHISSEILRRMSAEYSRRGWTMQLHIGAQRYTSTRLRKIAGEAGGFASLGACCDVASLTKMLDDFEKNESLPNILLFTLNPADNAVMSTLSGSYSQAGIAGKVQQGPAWWWCDHIYGMREVFESISSFGVLSVFIGMTTDSRSLLSFVRHDYFRRVFCSWIGEKAARGEFPNSYSILGNLVRDVCYNNAKKIIEGVKQNEF